MSNSVYDIGVMNDASTFRSAVSVGNFVLAISSFASVSQHKALFVKVLLEAAIDYVSLRSVDVINTVFAVTSIDMPQIYMVTTIKMMCGANKSPTPYTAVYTDKETLTIDDMIEQAGDKCNQTYVKLRYCDSKYWSYPLYLKEYAQEESGLVFHYAEEPTSRDKGMVRKLEGL